MPRPGVPFAYARRGLATGEQSDLRISLAFLPGRRAFAQLVQQGWLFADLDSLLDRRCFQLETA